jgi:medium-chain acyl-[acyl-carrier-protein] hydrolase
MTRFIKQYSVTNAIMDSEYRLSLYGSSLVFQDAFAAYMARYKRAAFDLKEIGKMWIISEFTLHFTGIQPFWGETVDVELWISDRPCVKVCADFRMSVNGRVFAEGNSSWAVLDIATRKPQIVTDLLSMIEVDETLALGARRMPAPASEKFDHGYVYPTDRADMDFNMHVSNVGYVNASQDAMPWEYLSARQLESYTIHFLHESFIGDELRCQVYDTAVPDCWNVEILSRERVCCRISMKYREK